MQDGCSLTSRLVLPARNTGSSLGIPPSNRERYLKELTSGDASEDLEVVKRLLEEQDRITLVFAAKDTMHNNAVALRDFVLNDRF